MKQTASHTLVPALAPTAFCVRPAMPVQVPGCRSRGRLAVTIADAGSVAGLVAAVAALKGRLLLHASERDAFHA